MSLALVGFTLLTLAVFRPTPSELAHTLPAVRGHVADALLLTWATSHVSQTLLTDPRHVFDAGIFYPARQTLACGDHMIGQALLGLPVWLATGNPLLEYNVLSLASYALAATTMFVYVRSTLGLGAAAAAAAGITVAFTPFRFQSPLWLQVLWTAFVPLTLHYWLRFVSDLRRRDWAAWVACWTIHSLMGMYLTFYFALLMGVLALFGLGAAPTRHRVRLRLGTLLAPVAVGMLLLPTLWPYVLLRLRSGNVRTAGLDTFTSFLLPGPGTLSGALTGLDGPGQFGPGLIVWALLALGLIVRPRAAGAEPGRGLPARFLWWVHVVGLATTLLLLFVPIRWQHLVPGFDMVRNTNRVLFVGLFFVGALVAHAVAIVQRHASGRRAAIVGAALVTLVAVDMGTPPRRRLALPIGAELSPAVAWLQNLPAGTPVYEHAHGSEQLTRAMYHTIFHRQPMPHGYSGFSPPAGSYANHILYRFPSTASRDLLRRLGVRYVWMPFRDDMAADRFLASPRVRPLEVAARFGSDVIFVTGEPGHPTDWARSVVPLAHPQWSLASEQNPQALPSLRDGDPATVWQSKAEPDTVPIITIDLGEPRAVAGIRLRARRDGLLGIALSRVETSLDGTTWERSDTAFLPADLDTFVHHPPEVITFDAYLPGRPRYIRLLNPQIRPWRRRAALLREAGPRLGYDARATTAALDWGMVELDVLVDRPHTSASPFLHENTDSRAVRVSMVGAR